MTTAVWVSYTNADYGVDSATNTETNVVIVRTTVFVR